MVLRLHQHNIGYTADGFYRSDDLTNSVKALKEGTGLSLTTGSPHRVTVIQHACRYYTRK